MRFENTSAFYYLWLILIVFILSFVFIKVQKKKLGKIFGEKLAPFLMSSLSMQKRKLKWFLQGAVLFFFVLALARPQMGQSKTEVKSEGVEVMLLVDVSDSMMAEDVKPNRLEQVKSELNRLLDLMPGNKIGIVAFAGSATLLSPLSNDPGALKMYVDSLSTLSVSTQGTEFKRALLEAKESFKRGGVSADESTQVTRVILIFSDGEDHEPGAVDQAQKLADEGVRIFSLAYGTEKGAPIPERDNMGFLRGYKKDHASGQPVLTQVHGDALKEIAQAGKGSFYHASFGGSHIQNIVEDINQLEKTQFETQMAVQYEEKFQLFLIFAFLLALIEIILGERRSASRIWRGRFEVPIG